MEFNNEGSSVYHRVQAVYARSIDGRLNRIVGPKQQEIQATWQIIQPQLCKKFCDFSHIPVRLETSSEEATNPRLASSLLPDLSKMSVYEAQRLGENDVVGLIIQTALNTPEDPFQNFFASLLLTQLRLHPSEGCENSESSNTHQYYTKAITDLFNIGLRHVGTHDKWDDGGREYFERRIARFTSRDAKVEFCLPAFPCKSSNPDKVMGTMPDKGEEMALLRLHSFVKGVEAIYKPGAKIWIISDGHVFSDCSESFPELLDIPPKLLTDTSWCRR
jgi:hypothetical protein